MKKKNSLCQGGLELHLDPDSYPCIHYTNQGGRSTFFSLLYFVFAFSFSFGVCYFCFVMQTTGFRGSQTIALETDNGRRVGDVSTPLSRIFTAIKHSIILVGVSLINPLMGAWDWAKTKINRNQGYAPVDTYLDPNLSHEDLSLQLDDN
jgi:hypothetical protein